MESWAQHTVDGQALLAIAGDETARLGLAHNWMQSLKVLKKMYLTNKHDAGKRFHSVRDIAGL